MTKIVLRILSAFACLLLHFHFMASPPAVADDGTTLTIGSQAPDIDIETWISDRDGAFEHVTTLQPKKIYVIEFWATWCGPCIASMPHLSKIQDKYIDDDVQIISISSEDMETVDSFLDRNVNGNNETTYRKLTSNYCLTVDPDRSVHKSLYRAAGQSHIPCAFIIGKTGLIEWIGHPKDLEEPLEKLKNEEWDRGEFLVEFKKSQAAKEAAQALQQKMKNQLRTAIMKIKDEDAAGGIEIIDEMLANEDFSKVKEKLEAIKTMVLIIDVGGQVGIKEMEKFVERNSENPIKLGQMAATIYSAQMRKGSVDKTIISGALRAAKTAAEALPEHPAAQETFARLVHQSGNLDLALEIMEKANERSEQKNVRVLKFLKQLQDEKLKDQVAEAKSDKEAENNKAKNDEKEAAEASSPDAPANKN